MPSRPASKLTRASPIAFAVSRGSIMQVRWAASQRSISVSMAVVKPLIVKYCVTIRSAALIKGVVSTVVSRICLTSPSVTRGMSRTPQRQVKFRQNGLQPRGLLRRVRARMVRFHKGQDIADNFPLGLRAIPGMRATDQRQDFG